MSEKQIEDESIPFYPDHVKTEFYVTLGILVLVFIVGILGLSIPVGLGAPADPLNTPEHVKPEWYFPGPLPAAQIHPQDRRGGGPGDCGLGADRCGLSSTASRISRRASIAYA